MIIPDYMTEEEVKDRIVDMIKEFKKMGTYMCPKCNKGKMIPVHDKIAMGITGYLFEYDCKCNNFGMGVL